MKITVKDLNLMEHEESFLGFGYLGHEFRTDATDVMLVGAINQLGLSKEELFLWVNSRAGRHFMDTMNPSESRFVENITEVLPILKKEQE